MAGWAVDGWMMDGWIGWVGGHMDGWTDRRAAMTDG